MVSFFFLLRNLKSVLQYLGHSGLLCPALGCISRTVLLLLHDGDHLGPGGFGGGGCSEKSKKGEGEKLLLPCLCVVSELSFLLVAVVFINSKVDI